MSAIEAFKRRRAKTADLNRIKSLVFSRVAEPVFDPFKVLEHHQRDFRALEGEKLEGRVFDPVLDCWVIDESPMIYATPRRSHNRPPERSQFRLKGRVQEVQWRIYDRDVMLTDQLWAVSPEQALERAQRWCNAQGHDPIRIRIGRVFKERLP